MIDKRNGDQKEGMALMPNQINEFMQRLNEGIKDGHLSGTSRITAENGTKLWKTAKRSIADVTS
jgi:hypothetical protein